MMKRVCLHFWKIIAVKPLFFFGGFAGNLSCDLRFYMLQYLVVKRMKNYKNKKYDIAVLGGGASGMMAAIFAAKGGASVVVLECNDSLGRKILATGNGRCNFTNKYINPDCYFSQDLKFPETALHLFSQEDTVSFFRDLGIYPVEREGYYYPRTQQAKTIQKSLIQELKLFPVDVILDAKVCGLEKRDDGFEIKYQNQRLMAKKVIMAMGGKSSDIKGSNGDGYYYATKLGHNLVPLVPALVQLHTNHPDMEQVRGVRCESRLSLICDNQVIRKEQGELQLTKQGLSGIVVFQLSRMAANGLLQKEKIYIEVDFVPELSESELKLWLEEKGFRSFKSAGSVYQRLSGLLNEKLIPFIVREAGIDLEMSIENLSDTQMLKLLNAIKHHRFEITETHGFKSAQVTAGGISTKEINPETMESLLVPGLYFAGEIMDVDGICGGYNLQWAWTSGALAGQDAAKDVT